MTDTTTKKAPTKLFVVQNRGIFIEDGKKSVPGDVVSLTAKQAKAFSKLGALAPYIEEGEDEDDE